MSGIGRGIWFSFDAPMKLGFGRGLINSRGKFCTEQGEVSRECFDLVAVGSKPDVSVGPDDEECRLIDTQLVGSRCKPRLRGPHMGAGGKHGNGIDYRRVDPGTNRGRKWGECFGGCGP